MIRMCSRFAWTSLLAVGLGLGACRTTDPTGSKLVVHAPDEDADAGVFVDGTYVGNVRALSSGKLPAIQLAPGVHRLEVRKPGRFPVQRTVEVPADAPAEIVVEAELLEDPA
jgi:hypothetical protein